MPYDRRVWNEALSAKEFGYDVSVISPAYSDHRDNQNTIQGIRIYRHPTIKEGRNKLEIIREYANAMFWEIILAIKIYIERPFHLIHGANPPDHLFLIALMFRFLGVKYIFDHHDLSPETYVAKFGEKGFAYKVLLLMERLSFKAAHLVISTNESYKRIAIQRGGKRPGKIVVVRNGPDTKEIPDLPGNPKFREGFSYLVGYVGIIGQQEGIENLLEIVNHTVRNRNRTDIRFIVIGFGPHLSCVVKKARDMGLARYITFTGYVPDHDLYEMLASFDVCVNPEYRNQFTDQSTMIKIMEYMAFGRPILQFYTKEGEISAGSSAVYIRENDTSQFADELIKLLEDPEKRSRMGAIGKQRIKDALSWDLQKQHLKAAYERVLHS